MDSEVLIILIGAVIVFNADEEYRSYHLATLRYKNLN